MSTHLPVGVFDSGVGGLTVVSAIQARLSSVDIHYVADSAFAPYGTRPTGEVLERCRIICRHLLDQGVQAVVVACNTATAMAVERLREEFDVPIVAMEPAVKPAAAATRSGVVGVLATAGTLESERYRQLVDSHGHQVKVIGRVCSEWVAQVESGDLDSERARAVVAEGIAPLLAAGADTLVLGCTHFPFLADQIRAVAGAQVSLIDPAPAVAEQLARRLVLPVSGTGCLRLWSSRLDDDESERLGRLLGRSVEVTGF